MDTNKLKKLAQEARTYLIGQVTSKLGLVLSEGSAARREAPAAVQDLERNVRETSQAQVVEKVAYTWFNRFTALRFMDANGYTNPRVVTPAEGGTRPEILADALAGHFDDAVPPATRSSVAALLDGRLPSRDAQGEAYRLLLVAACNQWHGLMPFMFEKIADYTELLIPEDLLSRDSVLSRLRTAMTDEDCQDVEVIGWLYQFYISEKKDQVFAALNKNVKIAPENIPAATQLFTPHWIVRYLVENSLGRLWLLNRPASRLAEKMDYFIAPEEPETDFLRISRPEDIRICDPACGSGHMLTYAFDLLYAIYEEEGYEAAEIPKLILTHNLTGIEIDDRAGALAAFALTMKAAARLGRRRFLRFDSHPTICVMQDIVFSPPEMQDVAAILGRDLFTRELRETMAQFSEAKNVGSLIVPKLHDAADVARRLRLKSFGADLLAREICERLLKLLAMAEALSHKYHIIVVNPPYMGSKGMNARLAEFAKENYLDSKADLFAMFMDRALSLSADRALVAIINMQSWMFLSSFESIRRKVVSNHTITTMVHIGYNTFPELNSKVAQGVAFIIAHNVRHGRGVFFDLNSAPQAAEKASVFQEKLANGERFVKSADDFQKIPGSPIAYWVSEALQEIFPRAAPLGNFCDFRIGMATGRNEWHVRQWHEVSNCQTGFGLLSRQAAKETKKKWFPYAKGGGFRKWAGNQEAVVNWENDGFLLQNTKHPTSDRVWAHNFNLSNVFQPAICWTVVTTGHNSFRFHSHGFLFDAAAGLCQPKTDVKSEYLLGLLNSKITKAIIPLINSTINLHPGYLSSLPGISVTKTDQITALWELGKIDWDAYEISWDFAKLPLLDPEHRAQSLPAAYARVRTHWRDMTDRMRRLEEGNNRIFIDAYGLQSELTPEVPLEEITLTCNPVYRYGGRLSEPELEARLLTDSMAEFLHYAVGCMFGRYSLDVPGLILADQGETLSEYLVRVPEPSFMPDENNVVPVLDGDWFADDVTERFRKFLRVTFGEPKFQENLAFIETALGKEIRKWFTHDFFDYHVRRYKKRPIYWMFSSPKGSFNALIYLHRYRPDTVSIVLNEYLREFISKLQTERLRLEKLVDDTNASQSQKTKALKDVSGIIKQISELTEWERDVVFPLAQAKIEIDLDDGVKRNYPMLGAAMKPIKGLEAADE